MKLLTYLLKNINLLNIALTALITAGVLYIFAPMPGIDLKITRSAASNKPLPETKGEPSHAQNIPPSDYTIIAEQNLFHPDRKIPAEKKADSPKPQPEFVLYGTLLADDISLAYIEDRKSPQSTPGRGKRQTALKKGDTISGFTLKEIKKDMVVMARDEETLNLFLDDSKKPKTREISQPQQTTAQQQTQPAQQTSAQSEASRKQAPQPPASDKEMKSEKKPLTPEKEKAATESAGKSFLDFLKQPQAR